MKVSLQNIAPTSNLTTVSIADNDTSQESAAICARICSSLSCTVATSALDLTMTKVSFLSIGCCIFAQQPTTNNDYPDYYNFVKN